jgi:hypothetical protein
MEDDEGALQVLVPDMAHMMHIHDILNGHHATIKNIQEKVVLSEEISLYN